MFYLQTQNRLWANQNKGLFFTTSRETAKSMAFNLTLWSIVDARENILD